MKTTRLWMLLAMVMVGLFAQAQVKLAINLATGHTVEADLEKVQKLSFNEGNVSIFLKPASLFFESSIKDVQSIKFINENLGVEDTFADVNNSLGLYYANDALAAKNAVEGCNATVYDLTGRTLLNVPSWDGSALDVSSLSKGVYIFKVNNETLKFQK